MWDVISINGEPTIYLYIQNILTSFNMLDHFLTIDPYKTTSKPGAIPKITISKSYRVLEC